MNTTPAPAPDPSDTARLQEEFVRFARIGCFEDPLYVAISEAAARRPAWAALLAAAPKTQRTPTLWFAALHDRLLELHDAGDRSQPLFAWYRSVGGTRAPDASLVDHVDAFLRRERAGLVERIATRSTQTNEIGRCATLWPALCELVRRTGRSRIALMDVGCSAGLNLGVDAWRYSYVDDFSGASVIEAPPGADPRAPRVVTRLLADAGHPFSTAVEAATLIVSRRGIDPEPIDVNNPVAVRWLRACLWPHDVARRERFDAAVEVARGARWPVEAVPASETIAAMDRWLATLPGDVLPVVFNSWVLAYFDAPSLEAHVSALRQRIEERGIAWVSAEPPQRVRRWWPELPAPGGLPAGSSVSAAEVEDATAWTLALRGGDGRLQWVLAARAHAHGRWMQWSA